MLINIGSHHSRKSTYVTIKAYRSDSLEFSLFTASSVGMETIVPLTRQSFDCMHALCAYFYIHTETKSDYLCPWKHLFFQRSKKGVTHLHHLSSYFQLAETVDDNISWHPSHTQHPALRAPGHDLNSEGVFIWHLISAFVFPGPVSVKHLGCFEFIKHLEHYYNKRREKR